MVTHIVSGESLSPTVALVGNTNVAAGNLKYRLASSLYEQGGIPSLSVIIAVDVSLPRLRLAPWPVVNKVSNTVKYSSDSTT